MRSLLIFADGRRVNLALPVDPETYAELEATQGRSTRKRPLLFCGGCSGGVYIRHGRVRRDELFGAHFEGDCPEKLAIRESAMSDEHRRMQEYTVRAFSDGGFRAATEVRTTRGTRVDVVGDGRIGVEVQLSKLTAGAAIRRTGRSMSAGLEMVAWCAESRSVAWRGKVPGYQWLDTWQLRAGLPRPHSVWASGLYTFRAERSRNARRWAPALEPLKVLVDDAVVRMAAGSIKPVVHAGLVRLVRDDGLALWEEMTGTKLKPFTGLPPARALPRSGEATCKRPRVKAEVQTGTCRESLCDEPGRPYENGELWLCPGHAWGHYVLRQKAS